MNRLRNGKAKLRTKGYSQFALENQLERPDNRTLTTSAQNFDKKYRNLLL